MIKGLHHDVLSVCLEAPNTYGFPAFIGRLEHGMRVGPQDKGVGANIGKICSQGSLLVNVEPENNSS